MPLKFIKSPADLVTSHKATVEGFLGQALVKTDKATPHSEAATKFHQALQKVQDINSLDVLLDDVNYRAGLIAAAGFSQKATNHLTKDELDDAIKRVFSTLKEKAGEAFREEIVYRYLLTKGDTLGGTMRNYIGAEAKLKLSAAISSALTKANLQAKPQFNKEKKVRGYDWGNRLLLFDVKTKFIDKNVDVILFDTSAVKGVQLVDTLLTDKEERQIKETPAAYLAAGELKGGIDPAGADEHWKTGRSALQRVNDKFNQLANKPHLFFVAAAIEESMATEIFRDIENGFLSHAANLTVPQQVEDLANWLVAL